MTFDQLDRLEHRRVDVTKGGIAAEALRGHQAAIDRHAVERRIHAADHEAPADALVRWTAGDAGEPHHDFAGAEVGQIAELVHRDDVLHVDRIALFGERRGGAFAFAGHLELGHLVNSGGEVKIAHSALTRRKRDVGAHRIETEIGRHDHVAAGRQIGEDVTAGVVGQGRASKRGQFHARTFEQIAGRRIAHGAGKRGCVRRCDGRQGGSLGVNRG